MKPYKFVQMDVFSRLSGKGNALAVVLDSHDLSDTAMQSIARWTRLAETTFTAKPTETDKPLESSYSIRMFAPGKEVPFAGHPSVGTAAALLDDRQLTPDSDGLVWQHGLAGVLPLKVSDPFNPENRVISLRNPAAHPVEGATDTHAYELQQATQGLQLGSLAPVLMAGGRKWWLVQAESESVLRHWSPAWDGIAALAAASDSMGICAYAFADDGQSYQVVTRALVGQQPTFEDAASGAANAILASHLFTHASDRIHGSTYTVSQGREIGSDALLMLERDADGAIWSGGQTRTAINGSIEWSE